MRVISIFFLKNYTLLVFTLVMNEYDDVKGRI